MHALAAGALDTTGLHRVGRSRWTSTSDELLWLAQLDRGASSSRWSLVLAALVHGLDRERPGSQHYRDADYRQEYALHPSGVPESAAQYRWDDHASYFTACFDHSHDLVDEEERARAFAYMAQDVAALFASVRTVQALGDALRDGRLSEGVLLPGLRALLPPAR